MLVVVFDLSNKTMNLHKKNNSSIDRERNGTGDKCYKIKSWHINSIKGASHDAKQLPCQDYCDAISVEKYSIAVVSDGHGGRRHYRSQIGSYIAVKTMLNVINNALSDYESFLDKLSSDYSETLKKEIEEPFLKEWNNTIDEFDKDNPLTDDEIDFIEKNKINDTNNKIRYGATVIATVLTPDYSFGVQIGDGDLVAIMSNSHVKMLVPSDDRCQDNITTSICDNKVTDFRHYYVSDSIPAAVVISSDGVRNTFTSDEMYCKYALNASVYVATGTEKPKLIDDLKERSKCGPMDDISMAIIYCPKQMKNVVKKVDSLYKGYFTRLVDTRKSALIKSRKSIKAHYSKNKKKKK